jgi:predicted transcriptional regulator
MAGHIAMSDGLIRLSTDWADVFRARIADLGLSHSEVDERAGLPDGYCNKIINGKKKPGAVTIERMCGALQLALRLVVDAEPGSKIAHLSALCCPTTSCNLRSGESHGEKNSRR